MITIKVNSESCQNLDITPVKLVVDQLLAQTPMAIDNNKVSFSIDFPRDPLDPRELSEIPEIRLWFIRVDTIYPWLPIILDWQQGELARYVAMLVPHQFHPRDGILYNPEALEIFLQQKIFVVADWLKDHGIFTKSKLIAMAQMLGYNLDEEFFDFIS
jgi:hypothetical protein